MRKHVKIIKTLALILVIAMFSQITTFALDSASGEIATEDTQLEEQNIQEDIAIIEEDITKRGEYEKHFLREDGSYTAVSYDEPVHYQTDDGNWNEIDNTLVESKGDSGDAVLQNRDGLMDVSIAKHLDDNLISISKDDYSVSFGLIAAGATELPSVTQPITIDSPLQRQTFSSTKIEFPFRDDKTLAKDRIPVKEELLPVHENVTARVVDADLTAVPVEERKKMAPKVSSKLVFEDTLGSGTDIEYILSSTKVKENIILEDMSDIAAYSFRLETEGLTAVLNGDNTVTLADQEGKIIFHMPAPYMFDSGNEYSDEIAVELEESDGYYVLTYTPDREWMEDTDRVWPVTVDPSVESDTATSVIIDRTVKNTGGTCPYNEAYLYVGLINGQTHYSYIRHTAMPSIPLTAMIENATEHVFMQSSQGSNLPITANRVLTSWDSTSITYANRPQGSNLSLLESITKGSGTNWYGFDITEAAGVWYDNNTTGTNANYGIVLSASGGNSVTLGSGDHTNPQCRPIISVDYYPAVSMTPGTYFIRNLGISDKFLDAGSTFASQTAIVTYKLNGTMAQQWRIESKGDNKYAMHSVLESNLSGSNQYTLSVKGGLSGNNGEIVTWQSSSAQTVTFHQRLAGQYYIRMYNSRIRVLEMVNNTNYPAEHGKRVKTFRANMGGGMQWAFERVNDKILMDVGIVQQLVQQLYPTTKNYAVCNTLKYIRSGIYNGTKFNLIDGGTDQKMIDYVNSKNSSLNYLRGSGTLHIYLSDTVRGPVDLNHMAATLSILIGG